MGGFGDGEDMDGRRMCKGAKCECSESALVC